MAAFGPAAWHGLETILVERNVKRPQLLDMTETSLQSGLGLSADQADRVVRLLGRGGPLAIEVERLASRGIWMAALGDEIYPRRLVDTLGGKAPPLLFGAGRAGIASQPSLAIVGSRDADAAAIAYSENVAASAVKGGLSISSGAARGVDAAAMTSALEHGGSAVGVVADSLEKRIREPQIRTWLANEQLCLISPYGTNTGFSVRAAMGRNKFVYGLSEFALVVTAAAGRGGTWAGATEALKNGWSSVFVRVLPGDQAASGRLVALGARPFPASVPDSVSVDVLFDLIQPPDGANQSSESTDVGEAAASVQETLFGEPVPVAVTKTRARKRQKSTRHRAG